MRRKKMDKKLKNEKQKSIIFLKVTWFAVTHQFLFSFCIGLNEVFPSFWVAHILLRIIKVQALELVVLVEMESFAMG